MTKASNYDSIISKPNAALLLISTSSGFDRRREELQMKTKLCAMFITLFALELAAGCASTQPSPATTHAAAPVAVAPQELGVATAVTALPAPSGRWEGNWTMGSYSGTVVISELSATDDGKASAKIVKDGQRSARSPQWFGREQNAAGQYENGQLHLRSSDEEYWLTLTDVTNMKGRSCSPPYCAENLLHKVR